MSSSIGTELCYFSYSGFTDKGRFYALLVQKCCQSGVIAVTPPRSPPHRLFDMAKRLMGLESIYDVYNSLSASSLGVTSSKDRSGLRLLTLGTLITSVEEIVESIKDVLNVRLLITIIIMNDATPDTDVVTTQNYLISTVQD